MTQIDATTQPQGPLIFYDGECGLCSRSVQWFIRRDHKLRLRFAPLQGQTAAKALPKQEENPLNWSLILRDASGIHYRSDAVLRAAAHLGGIWRLARWLLICPRPLRDSAYRFIARKRYRWFGRHDACWLGDRNTRERILP